MASDVSEQEDKGRNSEEGDSWAVCHPGQDRAGRKHWWAAAIEEGGQTETCNLAGGALGGLDGVDPFESPEGDSVAPWAAQPHESIPAGPWTGSQHHHLPRQAPGDCDGEVAGGPGQVGGVQNPISSTESPGVGQAGNCFISNRIWVLSLSPPTLVRLTINCLRPSPGLNVTLPTLPNSSRPLSCLWRVRGCSLPQRSSSGRGWSFLMCGPGVLGCAPTQGQFPPSRGDHTRQKQTVHLSPGRRCAREAEHSVWAWGGVSTDPGMGW